MSTVLLVVFLFLFLPCKTRHAGCTSKRQIESFDCFNCVSS